MHILYIHQFFMTRNGIGNTSCYEFARQWVARGCRVTVVTAPNRRNAKRIGLTRRSVVDGIEVIEVNFDSADYMRANSLGFMRRLQGSVGFAVASCLVVSRLPRADVAIVTSPPLSAGGAAIIASRAHRAPLVLELHDLWPDAPIQIGKLRSPLLIAMARCLERLIYRASSRVVALSPGLRDGVIATGFNPAHAFVVPVGSDLDLFTPDNDGAAARERLGLGNRFVCSYFGAMGEANGLEPVVQAARILQERHEAAVVFVLHGDGGQRARLAAFCAEHQLRNVVFSLPVEDKRAIAELAAASNVCLTVYRNVPSMHQASPAKLFDTFAAGRPAIVNCPGWLADLVTRNDAGVFVPPDDPVALAETVARLRTDPLLCARLGRNARCLAEREFDRRHLADRYLKILRDVTGCSPQAD
jgi:glycosyltransferase involved in cell wall biosynthesis